MLGVVKNECDTVTHSFCAASTAMLAVVSKPDTVSGLLLCRVYGASIFSVAAGGSLAYAGLGPYALAGLALC
jgi:hypothetical protein